jgi:Mg-chelatase subunit ChlD
VLIGAITMLARVIGFGRQVVFAHTVQASCLGTAYTTANMVPNIIYDIVAGGALTAVVVPVLAGPARAAGEQDGDGDREQVRQTSAALLSWAVLLLVPVSLVVAVIARPLVSLLLGGTPGCPRAAMVTLGARMLVVFAPQILLYGVAVVLYGILQAHRRFASPALAPVLSSLVVIGAYFWFGVIGHGYQDLTRPVPALAWIVLAAGTTAGVAALVVTPLWPAFRVLLARGGDPPEPPAHGGGGGSPPPPPHARGDLGGSSLRAGRVRLSARDFEVSETERRSAAVVSLLVDLSYSMQLRGTWAAAKQTALALHALLRSRFPQDAVQVVGFSNYARELRETELAGLGWDMVQGTNLHHALMLAGRHIDRHPEHEPVVLVVTDGEPTAHLQRDGRSWFDWPPSPETVELTLAEVDKMTRRHAALNIFMLADDARLSAFVDNVARRNGGRVLQAAPERLGEYVIRDFLRTRGSGRR